MGVAICGSCSAWGLQYVGIAVCGSSSLQESNGVRVTRCGNCRVLGFGMWKFWGVKVAGCGRFGVWELRSVGVVRVAECGCYGMCKSRDVGVARCGQVFSDISNP